MALVRIGGEADKLGNHYEALWRLKLLLQVVAGTAESLVIESFDRTSAIGIDAEVQRRERNRFIIEFHSVKRQTASNDWTPSALLSAGESSPLGQIIGKLRIEPTSRRGIFVSTSRVEQLPQLCDAAVRSRDLDAFLERLQAGSQRDRGMFRSLFERVKEWTGMEGEETHRVLQAIDFEQPSVRQLEKECQFEISREIMATTGDDVDVAAVANHLAEFMRRNLGPQITRQHIFEFLGRYEYCSKNLGGVPVAVEQVAKQNNRFQLEAEERLIRQDRIPRAEAKEIAARVAAGGRAWVMLTGDAGTGKSCVLAQVVAQLTEQQIPALAFRLDTASPTDSMKKLKEFLNINWEPVTLLDGIASRQRSVLVIDQIDALSIVSGRRNAQQWSVLRQLIEEAKQSTRMSIVLACRTFDLAYDSELKALLRDRSQQTTTVNVQPLEEELVKGCLREEGVDVSQWSAKQLKVLRVPLHLDLFLRCKLTNQQPVESLTELYVRYLSQLRDRGKVALPAWNIDEALAEIVSCFSDHQAVAMDWRTIESRRLSTCAQRLSSEGLLLIQGEGDSRLVRFFHDTFFDHAFAESFVRQPNSLISVLTAAGERQELFRRTQCRQVLTFLREGSPREKERYFQELQSLLESPAVRVHMKFFLLAWLNARVDPVEQEWEIVSKLAKSVPWGYHVLRLATWNSVPWFDLLHRNGQWKRWLATKDDVVARGVTWMLGQKAIMQPRSDLIASLLAEGVETNPRRWRRRAWAILGTGEFYHSKSALDLFLKALDEDWADVWESGFWMHNLNLLPGAQPEGSIKLLRMILFRHLRLAQSGKMIICKRRLSWWQERIVESKELVENRKWRRLLRPGQSKVSSLLSSWLAKLAGVRGRLFPSRASNRRAMHKPEAWWWRWWRWFQMKIDPTRDEEQMRQHDLAEFISQCALLLPLQFAGLYVDFAEGLYKQAGKRVGWAFDGSWFRYEHQQHEIGGALNSSIRRAMENLAGTQPEMLAPLLERLLELGFEGLEILVMNTYAANPQHFSKRVIPFLRANPKRVFYQPNVWSGGNATAFHSRHLLQCVHSHLADDEILEVEQMILNTALSRDKFAVIKNLFEGWQGRKPDITKREDRTLLLESLRRRDYQRFTVLSVLPVSRLSQKGRRKLTVWTSLYGKPDHSPPGEPSVGFVGSPLERDKLDRMNDDDLLSAMKRYDRQAKPETPMDWSRHGLHGTIREMASTQRQRFYALLNRMDDSYDFEYFIRIVEGLIGEKKDVQSGDESELTDSQFSALINRYGQTQDKEMAKAICWALSRRFRDGDVKANWVQVVLDFALTHADPATIKDDHSVHSLGRDEERHDLHNSGINHVRGVACDVLANALFANRPISTLLRPFVSRLISDRSMAVRTCLVELLIAWLNVDRDEAVGWFVEMVDGHDELFGEAIIEHFLAWACSSHSQQLAPLIEHMAHEMTGTARDFGLRQTARCAAHHPDWRLKVQRILKAGDAHARCKVAEVASDMWQSPRLRPLASEWLSACFRDKNEGVQQQASHVFANVPEDDWQAVEGLAVEFVDSPAFLSSADSLVWRLDDANPLPNSLTRQVIRKAVSEWRRHSKKPHKLEKLRWGSSSLGKLLLLAYNNATETSERKECLDLLDDLLVEGLYGSDDLSKETDSGRSSTT